MWGSDLDGVRRSTLATVTEIVDGERDFKDRHGISISDPAEWMQLRDILLRIEHKLAAGPAHASIRPTELLTA